MSDWNKESAGRRKRESEKVIMRKIKEETQWHREIDR